MKEERVTRRHLMVIGAGAFALMIGCKKSGPSSCMDVSGLTAEEANLRKTLAYTDKSPEAAKTCEKCLQYTEPPSADQCGGCKIMKGPVHPKGYCTAFVAK